MIKLQTEPLAFTEYDESKIIVYINFGIKTIDVEKEIESFSLGSLVAECGGVLGLFVGFNFLMIWDWIQDLFIKMKHHFISYQ